MACSSAFEAHFRPFKVSKAVTYPNRGYGHHSGGGPATKKRSSYQAEDGPSFFRSPMPTRNVSEDLSLEALGLKGLTV